MRLSAARIGLSVRRLPMELIAWPRSSFETTLGPLKASISAIRVSHFARKPTSRSE